jgi:hypothetical protein
MSLMHLLYATLSWMYAYELDFHWIFRHIWPSSNNKNKQTPWPESACELYRPSNSRLSAKLVPTFADRGCHMISVTDPFGRIIGFLDRSCYFFFQLAPQLYSRGWVNTIPDPRLLGKSGSQEAIAIISCQNSCYTQKQRPVTEGHAGT